MNKPGREHNEKTSLKCRLRQRALLPTANGIAPAVLCMQAHAHDTLHVSANEHDKISVFDSTQRQCQGRPPSTETSFVPLSHTCSHIFRDRLPSNLNGSTIVRSGLPRWHRSCSRRASTDSTAPLQHAVGHSGVCAPSTSIAALAFCDPSPDAARLSYFPSAPAPPASSAGTAGVRVAVFDRAALPREYHPQQQKFHHRPSATTFAEPDVIEMMKISKSTLYRPHSIPGTRR